jgi:Tol biopolymer transport system component
MRFRHLTALVIVTTLGLVGGHVVSGQSSPARELLRIAVDTEVVDGDARRAVTLYTAIVERFATTDRDVAATALLRKADVLDKLGDPLASGTYQQVITRFGDVTAVAAVARQRLPQPLSQVQLWSGPPFLQVEAVSPDGRMAAFIGRDGNLAVHEFSTATDRALTNQAVTGADARNRQGASPGAAFSRDGRQVAFQWYGPSPAAAAPQGAQLRIASAGAGGPGEPRVLFQNPDIGFAQPFDWMPDGSAIAAALVRQDLTVHIALVSTRDGAMTVLKSTDWDRPETMRLSPDGRYLAFDLPAGDDDRNRDVFVLAVDGSLESRIAPGRSHEHLAGWSGDGRHLLFTSNRSGVSALYGVPMANGAPTGPPIVVKPDLGFVRVVGMAGSRLFYVVNPQPPPTEVRTGRLDPTLAAVSMEPLSGQRLSDSNGPGVWSPDGRLLAYESTERDGTSHSIVIQSVDEDRQVRVLRPRADAARELQWSPDARSFLTLSNFKGRYAISRLDAVSGELSTIVANPTGPVLLIRGQTWSADGSRIYYRRRLSNAPTSEALIEHELTTGAERQLHVMDRGQYVSLAPSPDGRYLLARTRGQGTESTVLLSLGDTSTRELPAASGDVLRWTPDSQAVWTAERAPDQVLLRLVPIDGRPATDGPRLPAGWGVTLSPDGTRVSLFTYPDGVAAPTAPPAREVWALDGIAEALGAVR